MLYPPSDSTTFNTPESVRWPPRYVVVSHSNPYFIADSCNDVQIGERNHSAREGKTKESDISRSVECYRILWSAGTKGEIGDMGQHGGGYNTSSSTASILLFPERCITLCHISPHLSPLLAITQPYSSLFQIVGESSLVFVPFCIPSPCVSSLLFFL